MMTRQKSIPTARALFGSRFTFHGLLNCFNAREADEGDSGLLLSERMLREILQVHFGIGQHILKVDGKATRLWKTSVDKWPRAERVHFSKEYLDGAWDHGPPEWDRANVAADKLPEKQRSEFRKIEADGYKQYEEDGTLPMNLSERIALLWKLEDEAGRPRTDLAIPVDTVEHIKNKWLNSGA